MVLRLHPEQKMNKKAVNVLMENLVFILLVIFFVITMYFVITRVGSQAILFEQVYAKQISLIINKAKPGIEIEIDIYDMNNIARKNKFNGNYINVDNNENRINVKLVQGKGYDYYYFNDVDVVWNLDKEKRKLFLKIIENNNANMVR